MTTASKITLVRVAFIPVYMTLMYISGGVPGIWLWLSLAVFILAGVTDYVDGTVARKYNQVTDKLMVIGAMTIFCQWGLFPAWALMIVLTREFAVTGLRLVAVGKGTVIAAGWSGKVKTASTMISLCVWMAFPTSQLIGWIAIGVIIVTTVYSGIEYFIQNRKCLWQ